MSLRSSVSRALLAATLVGCSSALPPAYDPNLPQEYAAGQVPPPPLPKKGSPEDLPCEALAPRADSYGNSIEIALSDHWAWSAFVRCFPNARIVTAEMAFETTSETSPETALASLASFKSIEWLTLKLGRDTSCSSLASLPILPSVKHVVLVGACQSPVQASTSSRLLGALPSLETLESQSLEGQVHFHASATKIAEISLLEGREALFDVAFTRFESPERVLTIGPVNLARVTDSTRLKEVQATVSTLETLGKAPLESVTLLPSAGSPLLPLDTLARFPGLRKLVVRGDVTIDSVTKPLPVEDLETDRIFQLSALGRFPKLKKLTVGLVETAPSPTALTKPALEILRVHSQLNALEFFKWMPPAEEVHLRLLPNVDLSPLVHLKQTKRLTLEATPEVRVSSAPDMRPLANVKVAHLTLVGCFRNAETTTLEVGAVETRDYVCFTDDY